METEAADDGAPERGEFVRGEVVREFRPHWRVLLAVILWTLVAIAAVALVFNQLDGQAAWLLTGLVAVGWLSVTVQDLARWLSTTYTLTTDQIIVKTGILRVTKAKIPLESIDNITMTRNLAERMLGYGDMVIESTQGQSVFADIPDPEEFEAEVLEYRDRRRGMGGAVGGPGAVGGVGAVAPRDPVERLRDLADLHERGALTDAEFEDAKARLLGEL